MIQYDSNTTSVRPLPRTAVLYFGICYLKAAAHFLEKYKVINIMSAKLLNQTKCCKNISCETATPACSSEF